MRPASAALTVALALASCFEVRPLDRAFDAAVDPIVDSAPEPPACDGIDDDCDGVDDDCDGATDEQWTGDQICGEGACAAASTPARCVSGFVVECRPGTAADEVCNAVDDDCDGRIDEGVNPNGTVYYRDLDGDGYGGAGEAAVRYCDRAVPDGYATTNDDCDETGARAHLIHPGADYQTVPHCNGDSPCADIFAGGFGCQGDLGACNERASYDYDCDGALSVLTVSCARCSDAAREAAAILWFRAEEGLHLVVELDHRIVAVDCGPCADPAVMDPAP